MKTTRRTFFGLLAGLFGLAVAPKAAGKRAWKPSDEWDGGPNNEIWNSMVNVDLPIDTQIGPLSHLEGKHVDIIADGTLDLGNDDGSIVFPDRYTRATVTTEAHSPSSVRYEMSDDAEDWKQARRLEIIENTIRPPLRADGTILKPDMDLVRKQLDALK